ncbi:DUF2840 domain-containing protein [Sphingosinicella rhizophila]|uniref:DUF2840 domain-containing protein n=1 Tax=Sphingosinicella rhizophila TaxID=3050082 RepID=UPI0028EBC850|nr:DUF2840 domain-containing protein [Sphingosinicella sp. GR2756]
MIGRAVTELTHVELTHVEGVVERWIRFGLHAAERIIDRRSRELSFPPGAVFAFVRWRAGEHGTAESRIDILRAVSPGEPFSTVPFVTPGGESLLRLSGWPKVARVLEAIDAVERLGLDPADAAPDHWRHVHNQLATGREPRAYAPERHRAWLLRKRVSP